MHGHICHKRPVNVQTRLQAALFKVLAVVAMILSVSNMDSVLMVSVFSARVGLRMYTVITFNHCGAALQAWRVAKAFQQSIHKCADLGCGLV